MTVHECSRGLCESCGAEPVFPCAQDSHPTTWCITGNLIINNMTCPVQFSSVVLLCPTLCNPMDRSTPGLPVHHQLPEFTQTHVHWVSEAIQPCHPLSSPSPAFNLSQHQGLSQWPGSLHQAAKGLAHWYRFAHWCRKSGSGEGRVEANGKRRCKLWNRCFLPIRTAEGSQQWQLESDTILSRVFSLAIFFIFTDTFLDLHTHPHTHLCEDRPALRRRWMVRAYSPKTINPCSQPANPSELIWRLDDIPSNMSMS